MRYLITMLCFCFQIAFAIDCPTCIDIKLHINETLEILEKEVYFHVSNTDENSHPYNFFELGKVLGRQKAYREILDCFQN